jgi:adenylate cyclase
LRVYSLACRGLAHITAARLSSAIEDFSSALGFARTRKAGLENEARLLADLANAHRLNGDAAAALATANEAIEIATSRHARVPECLARIVRSGILAQSALQEEVAEAARELDRARELMQATGSFLFEGLLEEVSENRNSRHLSTGIK